MISKAWALQIMGKMLRVLCHGHPSHVTCSLSAAVSDAVSLLRETCSTLIAYDVCYLVAQKCSHRSPIVKRYTIRDKHLQMCIISLGQSLRTHDLF